MRLSPWFLVLALLGAPGVTEPVRQAPVAVPEDPFQLPWEAQVFAAQAVQSVASPRIGLKLQSLLQVLFTPREEGGMGMTYDNARTRTVAEVWAERKGNCLSMTAFFVAAAQSMGIRTTYAEALNTTHWRRSGSLIRFERHVVALVLNDMVADFTPQLRKRAGHYVVSPLTEKRFRSLFYSNRAVEALGSGHMEEAMTLARTALDADPKCGIGWNLLGVVEDAQGDTVQAERDFLRALSLDPKDGTPVGNLERLFRETGRLEEADTYRRMGEEVRRKDPYFHADLAEEALDAGDLQEASRRIGLALGLKPQEPEFFLLEGRLRQAQGQWDEAIKAIRKARAGSDPRQQARLDEQLAIIEGLKPRKKSEL